MPNRFEAFADWNLRDQNADETLGTFEMAISGRSLKTLPVFERRFH
jgi:hypothetical protein